MSLPIQQIKTLVFLLMGCFLLSSHSLASEIESPFDFFATCREDGCSEGFVLDYDGVNREVIEKDDRGWNYDRAIDIALKKFRLSEEKGREGIYKFTIARQPTYEEGLLDYKQISSATDRAAFRKI